MVLLVAPLRLYWLLCRQKRPEHVGVGTCRAVFEEGKIRVYRNRKVIEEHAIQEFNRTPNAVFRLICKSLVSQ